MMSLARKIVIVQWFIGFIGAWVIFSAVSSIKNEIQTSVEIRLELPSEQQKVEIQVQEPYSKILD